MGYRSQVFYGASFPTDEQAEAAMMAAKLKFDFGEAVENSWFWDDHCELVNGHRIIFTHSAVKWYDTYDSIINITSMFEWFQSELGAHVKFVRIGEEMDDIEIIDDHDDYEDDVFYEVYPNISLQTPWGTL